MALLNRRRRFNLTNPQYLLAQALQKGIPTGPARGGWTEGLSRIGQAFIAKQAMDEANTEFKADEINRQATLERAIRAGRGFTNPDDTFVQLAGPIQKDADGGFLPISRQPGARTVRTPRAPSLTPNVLGQKIPSMVGGRQAMAEALMGSKSPDLQDIGMTQLFKTPAATFATVKNPFGLGGVGQQDSITGEIKNYQKSPEVGLYEKGNIKLSAMREARDLSQKLQNGKELSATEVSRYKVALRILGEPDTITGFNEQGQKTVTTRPGVPASFFAAVPGTQQPQPTAAQPTAAQPTTAQPPAAQPPAISSSGNVTVVEPIRLPPQAIKEQNDDVGAVTTSLDIKDSMEDVVAQIDGGEINFGLFSNFLADAVNFVGESNQQTRNFSSFKNRLEKLRNDSLRLNKGMQTEGDAQRALKELFGSLNDQDLVRQRLKEISDINKRGAAERRKRIRLRREEYGKPDLKDSYFTGGRRTTEERRAIRLGREAIRLGANVEDVIRKAEDSYGIKLTKDDF